MSDSGKSLVTAGLSRIMTARPIKVQNMSLNSYSTSDGGEISFIQAYQAIGAGLNPSRENNPILLKPTGKGIEVVFMGDPLGIFNADVYYSMISSLWDKIKGIVSRDHVIEGAGGMGEPNFLDKDITVHKVASELKVNIILVLDIDRGGAFASAYGTYMMSPPSVRERMVGFIINKFRGDPKYLDPAISWLKGRTGMVHLGTIPYEEGLNMMPEDSMNVFPFGEGDLEVGVIAYPYMSNFNELFALVKSNSSVKFVRDLGSLKRSDVVILPGSRNTIESLSWLRSKGFEDVIKRKSVIGICGGFQMMGSTLIDKIGIESGTPGTYNGMGIFDFDVIYGERKVISQSFSSFKGGLRGYEIRRGEISYRQDPLYVIERRNGNDVEVYDGAMNGDKIGTSVHGFMFSPGGKSLLKEVGIKINSSSLEEEISSQVSLIEKILRSSVDLDKIEEIYKS
jgi:adenosylcobyric acid synthase